MIIAIIFFICGVLISFFSMPWVLRLAEMGVGLDKALEARKTHHGAIPRLGGAPIMLAALLGLIMILSLDGVSGEQWWPVLIGSILMYVLGVVDDLRGLGARWKLLGQLAVAGLMYWMGLSIDRVSYPGGAWTVELAALSLPITIFWLIAVPNIINLIDGLDGLAGGLGVFLASTLGLVALHNSQQSVAWFAFILAGSLVGFLFYNFPPAKVYLGDGGAYLIGFCIAALSLTSSNKGSVAAVLLLTVVALGLPILDTLFAIGRRALRGMPLFAADSDHIHHHLQRYGLSKRRVVLFLYAICVVLSLLGLSIVWSQGRTLPIGLGALLLLAVLALRYFHLLKDWKDVQRSLLRLVGVRRKMQYALAQAKLLELEVDRCQHPAEFWEIFDTGLKRAGFVAPDPEGHSLEIILKDNAGQPYPLHGPAPAAGHARDRARRDWQRVADCFRPAYAKAKSKWPT